MLVVRRLGRPDRRPGRQAAPAARSPRRAMALPALAMLALTARGRDRRPGWCSRWSSSRGCVNAVDNPTRQAFVMEMVGADRVVNAVSLEQRRSSTAPASIGPAIAGVLIATIGVEPCFAPQRRELRGDDRRAARDGHGGAAARRRRRPRARAASAQALRYVRATPELRIPLGLMASWEPSATTSRRCCRCWRRSPSAAAPAPTRRYGRDGPRRDRRGARERRRSARRARRCCVGAAAVFGALVLLAARRADPRCSRSLVLAPLGAAT